VESNQAIVGANELVHSIQSILH